jgi:hypothetical protein
MTSSKPQVTQPSSPPLKPWHVILTLAVATLGIPFGRQLVGADAVELCAATVMLMALVGIFLVSTISLLEDYNREARRTGRLVLSVHDYVLRIRDLLTDNPWLASNPAVRQALLPSHAELRVFNFHSTMAKELAECRAGTSWMMEDGVVRAGGAPQIKLAPELEATRHFAARLEKLRRENFYLKAELQILRRQRGFKDGEAEIQ